jgi:serine/threonine protein kinase
VRVGRYEIVRELGRGGMARVHLARQLDLDRYAALKELGSLHREDAEMAARFVRESRLAGALNHPSIVTVLDFFEHDGTPYIAMEYVPRGSLRPWVGQLTTAQVGGVLESVLAGLAHAHAGNVVHRDLKPENLMVTDDGHVKITDFGIAKALTDSATFRTATGTTIGTPAYMAPEQAMGEGVGPSTDLYATGAIAYELFSGAVPFANREPIAILLAHVQEPPVPLAERAPEVPAPIAAWVDRLLAKAPEDRPPSAQAAWDELEEHLLECAGPRWRRSARLVGEPGEARAQSQPITPAQFPSEGLKTPAPPGPATPPEATTPTGPTRPTAAAPGPPGDPGTPPTATRSLPARRRRGLVLAGAGLAVVALVAVVLAITLPGEDESPPATPASSADGPLALGDGWMRAVHVVSYDPEGFAKPGFVDAVRRAKAAGATHVILHPMVVADSVESAELEDKPDAPTNATLAVGIGAADREGVKAIIQPYLEVTDDYPGAYAPSDTGDFFDAWRERVAAWADIAGEHGAEAIVVGTMFSQLDGPDHTDDWTAILNDSRRRCGCQVTYSAEDVEGAERIQFWDVADAIGVSPLAALTDEPSTDVEPLERAWRPLKRRLQELNARWGKEVVLTDLGYESKADQSSAAVYEAQGEPSEEAQAALYEAAFRAFQGNDWFGGIGWFELNGDGEQPEADDYSFAGKQAEEVLRAWQTAS